MGVSVMCVRTARLMFGSFLNVTCVLIFPFIALCSLQVLVGFIFPNFLFPCAFYWVILMIYFIATLLLEILAYKIFRIDIEFVPTSQKEEVVNKLFLPIIFCYLLYMMYDTYIQLSNVDLTEVLQDEFAEDYGGSGGLISRLFLIICCTFFLGYAKKWYDYVIGLLCLIPSLVINTKGIIFMPILASFLVRAYCGEFSKIKSKVVFVAILGVVVFFGSYIWESSVNGADVFEDTAKLQQISAKFIAYLLSGVQGFNINVINPGEDLFSAQPNMTMAPLANFLSKFGIAQNISVINPVVHSLGLVSSSNEDTNVNTYVGTLFLYNGIWMGLVVHSVWIFITNGLKRIAQLSDNLFFSVLFCLYLSGFALGWFEFYFMHTFWIYFILITIVLYLFFRKKVNYE